MKYKCEKHGEVEIVIRILPDGINPRCLACTEELPTTVQSLPELPLCPNNECKQKLVIENAGAHFYAKCKNKECRWGIYDHKSPHKTKLEAIQAALRAFGPNNA